MRYLKFEHTFSSYLLGIDSGIVACFRPSQERAKYISVSPMPTPETEMK